MTQSDQRLNGLSSTPIEAVIQCNAIRRNKKKCDEGEGLNWDVNGKEKKRKSLFVSGSKQRKVLLLMERLENFCPMGWCGAVQCSAVVMLHQPSSGKRRAEWITADRTLGVN
jgi:hypothetical protein